MLVELADLWEATEWGFRCAFCLSPVRGEQGRRGSPSSGRPGRPIAASSSGWSGGDPGGGRSGDPSPVAHADPGMGDLAAHGQPPLRPGEIPAGEGQAGPGAS